MRSVEDKHTHASSPSTSSSSPSSSAFRLGPRLRAKVKIFGEISWAEFQSIASFLCVSFIWVTEYTYYSPIRYHLPLSKSKDCPALIIVSISNSTKLSTSFFPLPRPLSSNPAPKTKVLPTTKFAHKCHWPKSLDIAPEQTKRRKTNFKTIVTTINLQLTIDNWSLETGNWQLATYNVLRATCNFPHL